MYPDSQKNQSRSDRCLQGAGEEDARCLGVDSHTGGVALGQTRGFFTAAGVESSGSFL